MSAGVAQLVEQRICNAWVASLNLAAGTITINNGNNESPLLKITSRRVNMYITEEMISSMEDMQKNAAEMEKHIKGMMETEARMHGLELDSRNNARDMWHQLSHHMANADPAMDEYDMIEEELDDEHDPLEHVHEDGTEHSHEGGDVTHHHHEDGTTHDHEGGDVAHTHDDTLPSDVEWQKEIPADTLIETGEDSTQI